LWHCDDQEYEIVDYFLGPPGTNKLKDEVMKVQPVQKQTRAGQRTRFKAFVLVGDFDGHVGLGVKVGKEVANAIRGAILAAKLEVVPVRRGYWGKKIGLPHTVPNKIHGKCGSVHIRLVPAPRGTGIVAAPTSKRILQYAGVTDCFTSSSGSSATLGNFAKATFNALGRLYGYLTPDLWKETKFTKQPFQVCALAYSPLSCFSSGTCSLGLMHKAHAKTSHIVRYFEASAAYDIIRSCAFGNVLADVRIFPAPDITSCVYAGVHR
jgi:small subunit ribosomal protein S2e